MAQTLVQTPLSPDPVTALPVGHVATAPAHVAVQYDSVDLRDLLMDLIEKFEVAEDSGRKNRQYAERDIDYYDGKQWTDKEARDLEKRGQAAHVDNQIKPKIDYLQGLEQSQRTDPRALPRTPKHEDDAHSVTDALKSICDENNYGQVRSAAWADLIKVGWGGVEIIKTDMPRRPNPRVTVSHCPWDRMFWDPFSSKKDFSDARYLGLVLWMDRAEAVKRYGTTAGKVFDEAVSFGRVGGTFDDKPKLTTWVAYDKRWRVRVVQMYHLDAEGVWNFCEFTRGGFLNYGPSPYLDDDGKPEHPYSWRSASVDRDNDRYGIVRGMIDTQDAINKRQSKFLHLASVRQTFAEETALGSMSPHDMRKELAKPDGHVSLAPGKEFGKHFGIIPTSDMQEAQFMLLQQNMSSMTRLGPNASMQGKDPRDQSGRAILAQQQGGALEAQPFFDALRDMDHECYRKAWRRVRQYWTAEEWVRVTDDERNLRWVGINAPVMQPVLHPMTGEPIIHPQTGQPMEQPVIDPMTGQPQLRNQVAAVDIDIIIDDAPHVGTMQDEEFGRWVELAKISQGIAQLPPEFWIQLSQVRNKSKALEMIEQAKQKPPDPKLEAAKDAELNNTNADTELKLAQAKKAETGAILGVMDHAREGMRPQNHVMPQQPNVVPLRQ